MSKPYTTPQIRLIPYPNERKKEETHSKFRGVRHKVEEHFRNLTA
jgi:hypothetical protein